MSETSSAGLKPMPSFMPAPRTLEETGLSFFFILELIAKILYRRGGRTPRKPAAGDLSDSQIDLLHRNRVKEIMLAWDRDAKSKMIKMAEKLSGLFIVSKVVPYQHEAWDQYDLDLGDSLDPNCPMHSAELMEAEINAAIDVQSPEFCRWVAQ